MLLGSEFVLASANIVIATQVDIVREVLPSHHLVIVADKTIRSVYETNELNVRALGLVAQQTIDYVIATGCLTAHENKTNFLGLILVH